MLLLAEPSWGWSHNLGGPGAREVEDAQEEDRRAGTTLAAGTAGCAGLEAGRQSAPDGGLTGAAEHGGGPQSTPGRHGCEASPVSSWRSWAGRGCADTAGMELQDKQWNKQLARSGAGTASCGRSGDQVELVYGVDRDGTL